MFDYKKKNATEKQLKAVYKYEVLSMFVILPLSISQNEERIF